MKRLLVIAFLTSIAAAAQGLFPWPDPAQLAKRPEVSGATLYDGYPTNVPGAPVVAWWVAADYVTNETTWVSMPDRWTNSWALTNRGAPGVWPTFQASGLNGLPVIQFDGVDDVLQCDIVKSNRPSVYIWVLKWLNDLSYGVTILSGTNNVSGAFARIQGSSVNKRDVINSWDSAGLSLTNKWLVRGDLFNSASSFTSYTNAIVARTFDAGPNQPLGLMLASNIPEPAGANHSKIHFAEMVVLWTNTFSAISNIYSYLTNKYAISL